MTDTVIVRDDGFAPEDWNQGFQPAADCVAANCAGIEVSSAEDLQRIAGHLEAIGMIRVTFPSFADGRGFTLGRQLRALGYRGRLRAGGHVLADQYAMARRAGFDEVGITADLAARQPEAQWLARANWRAHDYQARLKTGTAFR